jgi:hypothetical protein
MNSSTEPHAPSVGPAYSTRDRDRAYWAKLDELVKNRGYSNEDLMRNWSAYVMRRDVTRFLAHYEIFKLIADMPGNILEFGTFRGGSLFNWAKFVDMFAPSDRHRLIFGFDSFEGLQNFRPEDGADAHGNTTTDFNPMLFAGALKSSEYEIATLCAMHNADSPLMQSPRTRFVAGDIMESVPRFIDEYPGLKVSLIHIDVDLYEPTKFALDAFWPMMLSGGVVVLDEYGFLEWPGETRAVDDFIASLPPHERPEIKKFPFAQSPCYFVKK